MAANNTEQDMAYIKQNVADGLEAIKSIIDGFLRHCSAGLNSHSAFLASKCDDDKGAEEHQSPASGLKP